MDVVQRARKKSAGLYFFPLAYLSSYLNAEFFTHMQTRISRKLHIGSIHVCWDSEI